MTVDLDVIVLPAFDDLPGVPGEATPWHKAYDLEHTVEIAGVDAPLAYTERGLAVVPTGVGKSAAATTTTALLASDELVLEESLILTVGVAGGPPTLPVGSVVVSDSIVDWDDKCRLDPDDADPALVMNPHTEGQGVFHLNRELVQDVLSRSENLNLGTAGVDSSVTERHDEDSKPVVVSGTNLCGDELWHGHTLAEQAEWLVDQYDAGPYRMTEMEDAGTAAALERFGALDRYLSIRGISNYDRPQEGTSARESLFNTEFEAGFGPAVENAVRVARQLVEDRLG